MTEWTGQRKWIIASEASLADISSDDYPYFLAYNAEWEIPKVRIGWYDQLERRPDNGNFVFRELHGTWQEAIKQPNPTHIARGPLWPKDNHE